MTRYLASAVSDPDAPGSRAFRQTFIAMAINPDTGVSHLSGVILNED
jgi:hypothetical protein